jgi:hypothetical protein
MIEEDLQEFFGEKNIKDSVEKLWNEVMEASQKFIRDSKKFGFDEIGILPNPTVHQMLFSLRLINAAFGLVSSDIENGKVDNDDIRLIFNARQQVLNMEMVATALNKKDRDAYDYAVRLIKNQAAI